MKELTYRKNGEYYIPNIKLNNENYKPLGKYGRMRKSWLMEHHSPLFNHLLLSEQLVPHLNEVDEQAQHLGNYEETTSDDDNSFCNIINNFVNCKWQGTATELSDSITEATISPTAITKKLNKNKDILLSVYGIRYTYERTKNKRIITRFREFIIGDTADCVTDDIVDIPTPTVVLQLPQNVIDVEVVSTEGCV